MEIFFASSFSRCKMMQQKIAPIFMFFPFREDFSLLGVKPGPRQWADSLFGKNRFSREKNFQRMRLLQDRRFHRTQELCFSKFYFWKFFGPFFFSFFGSKTDFFDNMFLYFWRFYGLFYKKDRNERLKSLKRFMLHKILG